MSNKSYFFEGLILGAIVTVLSMMFFTHKPEKNENEESGSEETPGSVETLIEQTREAIEKGFEKISDMMNDQKKKA